MTERTYSLARPAGLAPFGTEGGNPSYRKNQERARHNGHYVCETNCCAVCGKKTIDTKTYVCLSNVAEYITKEEYDQFDKDCAARGACSDDLGLYPVGSDCAKKLKRAGIPVYPDLFPYPPSGTES